MVDFKHGTFAAKVRYVLIWADIISTGTTCRMEHQMRAKNTED